MNDAMSLASGNDVSIIAGLVLVAAADVCDAIERWSKLEGERRGSKVTGEVVMMMWMECHDVDGVSFATFTICFLLTAPLSFHPLRAKLPRFCNFQGIFAPKNTSVY